MRSEKAIQTRLEQLQEVYSAHMRTLEGMMFDRGGFNDLCTSDNFREVLRIGERITDEMARASEVLGRLSALLWVLGQQESSFDEVIQ
jgi:hypothetical protein